MRVTNWMLLNAAIYDLGALREKYALAQRKVNGRSLERPSDNPRAVVEAIDLMGAKVRFERAQEAISQAKEWLSAGETRLTTMLDLLQSVRETAVQFGSPASLEPSARENLAQQIESLRDAIKREMNARHRDFYLFSGWSTDVLPFPDNGTGGVTYAGGVDQVMEREIAPGYRIKISIPGNRLPVSIIQDLTDMATAMRAGDTVAVTTTHLSKVVSAMDRLISLRSELGLSYQHAEQYENYARDGLVNVEERLGKVSGGDLAESVMEMTEAYTAYQTAIAAFSKALPVSLLDYMLR
ncbi:flagellar hook-associated protein 3 FlgL [Symbiobacterium terraclitae]|uniref:Flagellar hook-associated protein 3 FlgL n=1 Tax=Symbiobacterium terraclitae TaxID=557451 RepID=A0ABS4JNA6_9FIRM|nr:flagellin [Symbiobacterium terraclitae]MBP2017017.1 flagellar hook-associated protein 3 FlgL [Symbiobacterium terraclitae]